MVPEMPLADPFSLVPLPRQVCVALLLRSAKLIIPTYGHRLGGRRALGLA